MPAYTLGRGCLAQNPGGACLYPREGVSGAKPWGCLPMPQGGGACLHHAATMPPEVHEAWVVVHEASGGSWWQASHGAPAHAGKPVLLLPPACAVKLVLLLVVVACATECPHARYMTNSHAP